MGVPPINAPNMAGTLQPLSAPPFRVFGHKIALGKPRSDLRFHASSANTNTAVVFTATPDLILAASFLLHAASVQLPATIAEYKKDVATVWKDDT